MKRLLVLLCLLMVGVSSFGATLLRMSDFPSTANATGYYVPVFSTAGDYKILATGLVAISVSTNYVTNNYQSNVQINGVVSANNFILNGQSLASTFNVGTVAGTLRWDTTNGVNSFEGYNGNRWVNLSARSGGTILYDSRDGNTYNIATIGNQTWMLQNLAYAIPDTTTYPYQNNSNGAPWGANYWGASILNDTTQVSANYREGYLYTWDAAMQGSSAQETRGVCPVGWHIPSDAEWDTLENVIDSTIGYQATPGAWAGTTGGKSMRALSANGGGTGGTNTSGFAGVLAGLRNPDGTFASRGSSAFFWSSSEAGTSAWVRELGSGGAAGVCLCDSERC